MAPDFLSQEGRVKGNTQLLRCMRSCCKGRSSRSFFSAHTTGRIEIVNFNCSKGRFGQLLKKFHVLGRHMSIKDHESLEDDSLVSFQSSSSERAVQRHPLRSIWIGDSALKQGELVSRYILTEFCCSILYSPWKNPEACGWRGPVAQSCQMLCGASFCPVSSSLLTHTVNLCLDSHSPLSSCVCLSSSGHFQSSSCCTARSGPQCKRKACTKCK